MTNDKQAPETGVGFIRVGSKEDIIALLVETDAACEEETNTCRKGSPEEAAQTASRPVAKPDNVNPGHYKNRAHECIEFTQYLNFNLGNAFKYIWRHREKNGREDLEKALWYLKRQLEDSPKFKRLKFRRYDEMYGDLKDCGFDRDTEDALLAVLSAAYYIHDGEDNFGWAVACVKALLKQMPSETEGGV